MGRSIKAIIAKIDEYLGTPDFSASLWKTRYVKYKIKSIKVLLLVSKKYMNKYKHEYLSIIKNFKIKPELFELIDSPKIPDGSPIGSSNLNELCY